MGLQEGRLGRRNKFAEQWNARFKELLKYKSEHGHCDVPKRRGKLGVWVKTQRTAYMAASLAQDRIDRLSGIGFKWSLKECWDTRFQELLKYKAKHGDCDVSTKKGKLGQWVGHQRSTYKTDSLAQGRIDRLDSIGFKWSLKEAALPWETRFNELVQYKAKHGDCNVPVKQGQLGKWVSTQRTAYMAGSLAQDRIDRLNNVGLKWAMIDPIVPWETRFNDLVKYKVKHGDCDVPQRQGKLGTWVNTQRTNYKKDNLSKDRIDRLNVIGFDWTPPTGRSRKRKAPPSTRMQSSSRQMRVSSPSTNVKSVSVVAGASDVKLNGVKGKGFDSEPSLPLQIPSKRSDCNLGTESDDEVDEIGALIYDHAMRRKQFPMK